MIGVSAEVKKERIKRIREQYVKWKGLEKKPVKSLESWLPNRLAAHSIFFSVQNS